MRTVTWMSLGVVALALACAQPYHRTYPQGWGGLTKPFGSTDYELRSRQDPDLEQLLSRLDAAMSRFGFASMGARTLGLDATGLATMPIDLKSNECYTVAVIGETEHFLKLSLQEPNGAPKDSGAWMNGKASAQQPHRHWLSACPSLNGRYAVRVESIGLTNAGAAITAVAYRSTSRKLADLDKFFTEQEPPSMAREVSAAAPSTPMVPHPLETTLRARGYESLGAISGPTATKANTCYAIGWTTPISNARLQVISGDSKVIAEAALDQSSQVARWCTHRDEIVHLSLTPLVNQPSWQASLYRWPRGTQGPFGLKDVLYVKLAETTAMLGSAGMVPDPDFTPIKAVLSESTRSFPITLEPKTCHLAVVVADRDLSFKASIIDGGQILAVGESRDGIIELRPCSKKSSASKLVLTSDPKSVPVAWVFQVFKRKD